MASIPHELIRDVQIRTRARAGLPDYDPSDPTLPSLPSLSAEVATLDPSPADLRCENCKGRLLRGPESLICVYCGRVPQNDFVREPVSFNATVGYTWFLRSLGLDGSELVEPHKSKTEQDKGQSSPSSPMPLSEFLNFKIAWPAETGNQETSDSDEHVSRSPLSFTGVALDDFFIKSHVEAVLSDASTEEKSTQNNIETSGNKDVHSRESQSLSSSVPSFEAAKDRSGESQWEADFQSADLNDNRRILNDSGSTFPDSQPLNASMDIEQLTSTTETDIPSMSVEQKIINDHIGTSVNNDIAARDGHDLFHNVQPYEDVDSYTKEEASEAFSEWDADFQSATLDNEKSSDYGNKFQDSQPFDHFTGLEDNFAAHIDSVFGPGKDPNDGKVKDIPVASPAFDEWNSDNLWKNLSSKDSHTLGELDASTSNKNHVDDLTYNDSHDSSAASDFFEDIQWQNKGADTITNESKNEKLEKMDEDLVEGWGNFTGLGSVEVSSEAKIADIEDDKMKNEKHKTIDDGSFDEWGGFAGSSLQTSSETNGAGLKDEKTQNVEPCETTNDDLFDEWGNFGGFNVPSETKNVGVPDIMTKNEESSEVWGVFATPAIFQVSSTNKGSDMTDHEEKSDDLKQVDDDLFEEWGNFTSSTSMKVSSETKSADMKEIKAKEGEHRKADEDLFEGWGNFTSSTSLQASSETKNAKILESETKIEENKKANDDYDFDGWGDFNKSKDVELKPVDEDSFVGWSGFAGSTNLQVSSETKLDQHDNEVSTSVQRSSEMDFFNWDNSSLSTDYTKATKTGDSHEKSNQDKDDVKMLISQMHDLSFMLADDLRVPSSSNSSSKD